jgi:hypothetical protein
MLKALFSGIKKASSVTEVRKAATNARNAIKESPKLKGDAEKAALSDIKAMADNLIADMKSSNVTSKAQSRGTQKPVAEDRASGKGSSEPAAGRLGRSGASDQADYEVELGKAGTVESGKKSVPSFADMETSNKNRLKRNKKVAELETKVEKGTASADEKEALRKLNRASADADKARSRKAAGTRSTDARKDKGISLAGEGGKITVGAKTKYKDSELIGSNTNGIVRDTGEILGNPTPNQMDMAIRNLEARSRLTKEAKSNLAKLKRMSKSDRQDASLRRMELRLKDTGKDRPRNFKRGGLAQPNANQTGLKKLPTPVRNKMGYMKRGGVVKTGHIDMRKGGIFYK